MKIMYPEYLYPSIIAGIIGGAVIFSTIVKQEKKNADNFYDGFIDGMLYDPDEQE